MEPDHTLLLHDRIRQRCIPIYNEGHFKHAALEAMTIVEQSIKEKSGLDIKSAVALCKSVFNGDKGLQLYVPLGDDLQEQASKLFQGAFSYYRNYAAHDGTNIDAKQCFRVFILASELLDLLHASEIKYEPVRKLIDTGVFPNELSVKELLTLLNGYLMPELVYDGLYEDLARRGFSEQQMHALMDIGLIYLGEKMVNIPNEIQMGWEDDEYECFKLTAIGREILNDL